MTLSTRLHAADARCIRASITFTGGSVHAGVWCEQEAPIAETRRTIRSLLSDAMHAGNPSEEISVDRYNHEAGAAFARTWPGRAFLIETYQDAGGYEDPLTSVGRDHAQTTQAEATATAYERGRADAFSSALDRLAGETAAAEPIASTRVDDGDGGADFLDPFRGYYREACLEIGSLNARIAELEARGPASDEAAAVLIERVALNFTESEARLVVEAVRSAHTPERMTHEMKAEAASAIRKLQIQIGTFEAGRQADGELIASLTEEERQLILDRRRRGDR